MTWQDGPYYCTLLRGERVLALVARQIGSGGTYWAIYIPMARRLRRVDGLWKDLDEAKIVAEAVTLAGQKCSKAS